MKPVFYMLVILLCHKFRKAFAMAFDGDNSTDEVYNYNITCDREYDKDCQSETLESIAAKVIEKTNVHIDVHIPELHLSTNLSFTNLNSLTISGKSGSVSIICPKSSNGRAAGIVVSDINGTLILKKLNMVFCGAQVKRNFSDGDYKMYTSALIIVHCKNVELSDVAINCSRGLGMMMFDHQGGEVNITSTLFSENRMPQDFTGDLYGGGGVYVSLKYFPRGHPQSVTVLFQNCTFEMNVASTKVYKFIYNDIFGELRHGYGRGGGAYVHISSGYSNVNVSFDTCKFIGNQAFVGGGLSIDICGRKDNVARNITVKISNSSFERNGCGARNHSNDTGFGGGAQFSFLTSLDKSGIINSHFLVRNVTFTANCAMLGGGLRYYSYRGQRESFSDANSLLLDNCTFNNNSAHMGSAVAMTPYAFLKVSSGYTIMPTFQNCRFMFNQVFIKHYESQETQRIGGIGTVYSSSYDIQFEGLNTFKNNRGSAIYAVNGVVDFVNSSISFINNIAIQGGAIGLIGTSLMFVGQKKYEFINNKALHQGGAIYVQLMDSIDFISSRSCFIQYVADNNRSVFYEKWNISMTFEGNRASRSAGHAIYTTSLHPCQVIKSGATPHIDYVFLNASDVFTSQGVVFDDNALLQPQIATDGDVLHSTMPSPLMIMPGATYSHGVLVKDDFGRHINTSFRVTTEEAKNRVRALTTFSINNIQLSGDPDQDVRLYLFHMSSRKNYIKLDVKLLECPPGFVLNHNSVCVCNTNSYISVIECNLDTFHSYLLPGYWAGIMKTPNRSELVTCQCPFCDYTKGQSTESEFEVILPQNSSELSTAVCGETRTGVICGRCRENYTVHFHSPGYLCKPAEPVGCKSGWLFYILSELLPVTIVFITVLILNVRFTSGTVNGFILFGQLLSTFTIDAGGIITFPESANQGIKHWTQGYQILYGFINFDFFNSEPLSFCLWKNATALDMLAFKYVTILYTLLLIVLVIWITNKCGGRCGKYCRITTIKTSVIHGISTFLVFCYAQCIKISLVLLVPVWLQGNELTHPARVWLNGEILYFSREHLPYALPALLCLLTIGLVPPILLLTHPLANKITFIFGCNDLRIIKAFSNIVSINSLKPLLDSIQGCFKDNLRFFAGIYFLYRWVVPFTHIITNGFGNYYLVLGSGLLMVLMVHAICQPYIKRAHNVIDTFLLVDLIVINTLSLFNYYRSLTRWGITQGVTVSSAVLQLTLIYLPLIVTGICLIVVTTKKVLQLSRINNSQLQNINRVYASKKINTLRELIESFRLRNEVSSREEDEFFDQLVDEDSNYTSKHEYLNYQ